jgi:drug/metabolite transporter (DMT)-like permease
VKPQHLFNLLFLNVCWSATPSIYKRLEDKLDAGGVATLRFGLAAIILCALWPLFAGRAPRGWDLVKTVLLGLTVFCLGHRLQVYGVQTGSASNSAILMAIEPLITGIAAAVFLREHIRGRSWAGFALGVFGVMLLSRVFSSDFKMIGLAPSLFFLSSFLCETAYSVLGKAVILRSHYLKTCALGLLAGTVGNLLIDGGTTWRAAARLDGAEWAMVVFMATICTAIGYTYWFRVIQETDVNLVGLTIYAQPVSGFLLAWWWLGEEPHFGQFWGGVAIIAGLVVAFWKSSKVAALRKSPTPVDHVPQ